MRPARRRRLLVQSSCLAAAIIVLLPILPWEAGPRLLVQTSPLVAIGGSIATRTVGVGVGVASALALLSMVRRRWYCRYVCPTGLLLERAARHGMKRSGWWARWPPIGRYAAIATLLGALVGYPVFLWMDPIAIFAAPFAIRWGGDLLSGILAGLLLGALIPLTFMAGLVWCMKLCPLGGLLDLLADLRARLGREAARLRWLPPAEPNAGSRLARRAVLLAGTAGIGLGLGLWGRKAGQARADEAPLRPPGALGEEHFTGACIRCGNCAAVCPAYIIHPDPGRAGVAGLLAPAMRYDREDYCREDCNACTQVCPSGALQPLDLPIKRRYVIGEALLDAELCLTVLGRRECDACALACPYEAIRIVWDDSAYLAYPLVDYDRCNGCGACEVACPTGIVKAIRVWPLLEETAPDGTPIGRRRYLPPKAPAPAA